ncbi:helix-turn-helix domain-containing protein [Ruania alba]|uniref:Transcriptional regulator, AraC family n=1 Tax=Ruania alba TaxID=648782 RepID=A0A1H5MLR1_9MICO|nr:AraC family transcriptional regulator [Ruania alba]SEE89338.1 transcriptional regulator, AraC family [Ruania alba]
MPTQNDAMAMGRNGGANPATFEAPTGTFVADTCAPLREAGASGEIDLWAFGRGTYPGEPIASDVLPQLKNVGTWEITRDQTWGLDWHRNEGIEFTCVSAGAIPFSCEGEDFDLSAGHVTVTRPWQLHRVGRPHVSSSRLTWFILDVDVRRPNQEWVWPTWLPIPADDIARLTDLLSLNERPVWRASRGLLTAVDTLERTLRGEVSQPMARIATSVVEIFIELRDLLEHHEPVLDPYLSSTERTVHLFLERLRERLQECWSVDQMAAECGLGRTRFVHYCKQMTNLTPQEYLNLVRIEHAKQLLTTTDLLVSDIAQLCGFASSQYFSTRFRRLTGRQPAQLRRDRATA